jgi:hypothetical protein
MQMADGKRGGSGERAAVDPVRDEFRNPDEVAGLVVGC